MATQSKFLGLTIPTTGDMFSTQDVADNWSKIDTAPGTLICTSTTRPTLQASQAGRRIYETDTALEWVWTGTEWDRVAPTGLLKRTDGSWAVGQRTTDLQSTSSTSALVVAVNNVVVPPGNRTLMIKCVWSRAYSEVGYFYGRLHRSDVSNGSPMIRQWAITGANVGGVTNPDEGGGGMMYTYENGGLAPGVYSWSFQIATVTGGKATVQSNPTSPTEISVVEL